MGDLMLNGRMVLVAPPSAMKKGVGPILKEALMDAGELWHRRYLPRHFEAGAGNRYKYQARTGKYMARKQRKMGHRRPLEYTGNLRREVSRRATITGTSKRTRVVMDTGTAWYATRNWKTRGSMPDMPVELTKTIRREDVKISVLIELFLARRLNAIKTRENRA